MQYKDEEGLGQLTVISEEELQAADHPGSEPPEDHFITTRKSRFRRIRLDIEVDPNTCLSSDGPEFHHCQLTLDDSGDYPIPVDRAFKYFYF